MAGKHVGTDLYPVPDDAPIGITPAYPGSRINRAWAEGNDGSRPNAHVTDSPEDLAYLAGAASTRNHETAPPTVAGGSITLTVPDSALVGPITNEPAGTPDTAWVAGAGSPASVTGGSLSLQAATVFAYTNIQGAALLEGTVVRVSWATSSVGFFAVSIGNGVVAQVPAGQVGGADVTVGPDGNELRFTAAGNTTIDANVTAEII